MIYHSTAARNVAEMCKLWKWHTSFQIMLSYPTHSHWAVPKIQWQCILQHCNILHLIFNSLFLLMVHMCGLHIYLKNHNRDPGDAQIIFLSFLWRWNVNKIKSINKLLWWSTGFSFSMWLEVNVTQIFSENRKIDFSTICDAMEI